MVSSTEAFLQNRNFHNNMKIDNTLHEWQNLSKGKFIPHI